MCTLQDDYNELGPVALLETFGLFSSRAWHVLVTNLRPSYVVNDLSVVNVGLHTFSTVAVKHRQVIQVLRVKIKFQVTS